MKLGKWSFALGILSYVVLRVLRRAVTTLEEISLGNIESGILLLTILLAVGGTVLGVMSLYRKEGSVWWVAVALMMNIATLIAGVAFLVL